MGVSGMAEQEIGKNNGRVGGEGQGREWLYGVAGDQGEGWGIITLYSILNDGRGGTG